MRRRISLIVVWLVMLGLVGSVAAQGTVIGPDSYPEGINPLTGLPVEDASLLDRRPLLVKISNSPTIVRPQYGLNEADIIWEHLLSGGVTRFSAIYLSADPEQIGPIRSGRLVDFELTRIYRTLFVYSGMAQGTIDILNRDSYVGRYVVGGAGPCPALCRQPRDGVALEHTLFGSAPALRELAETLGRDTTPEPVYGMAFSEAVPEGGVALNGIDVVYNETLINWSWDAESGRWLRSQDGSAHLDAVTLTPVSAANVVVLEEEHTVQPFVSANYWGPGDFAFSVNFIGSGRIYLLRDGQYFEGEWRRESQDDVLRYVDLAGNPLPFKPGSTFVNLVPRWIDGYWLDFYLADPPLVSVMGQGGQNMHNGPSEAYRALDVAYPGDTFSAVGRNRSADWVQVIRDGDRLYWMPLAVLNTNGTDIMQLPVSRPSVER